MHALILSIIIGLAVGTTGGFVVSDIVPEANLGALNPFTSLQLATDPDNGECLTTNGTINAWSTDCGGGSGAAVFGDLTDVATSSDATGDIYYLNSSGQIVNLGIGSAGQVLEVSGSGIPEWDTDDSGAGGTGGLATTSPWSGSGVAWRVNDGTVSTVATTSLTASSPLSLSQAISVIGSSASALSLDTSGAWSGTAASLAANGANCSAGSFPLGVDQSGAVESCTDAWTEAENTSAAYAAQATTITVAGTANQITSSAGAQSLAANRTWTLSLPSYVLFPGDFAATNATTTNATTTDTFYVTGLFASTTGFFANGLASCTGENALTWTGGVFGCAADDNTTYTAGDALTLTGTDIDFDGGATPSGDLGGTWASPSVTDDSHAHTGTTLSGIDVSDDTNLTAGDGITLTGDDLDCDTASGSVFGCLSTTDWTTFNSKLSTYDAWTHPSAAVSATTSGIIITASSTIGAGTAATGLTVLGTATSTNLAVTSLTSALVLTNALGQFAEYAGIDCTNQFVRDVDALGAGTCASVASADITDGTIVNDDINGSAAIVYSKLSLTNSLLEADLKAVDAAADEECLTYETTTGDFEWQTCGSAGTGNMSGWATTTTAGQKILYPVDATTTDVIFGAEATSTAPFWWDTSATTTYIGNGGTGSSTIQYGPSGFEWIMGYSGADNSFKLSSSTVEAGLGINNVFSVAKTTLLTTFANAVTVSGAFIANAGATVSSFLAIPNGTGPTVDAAGEIAVDTTSGQFAWHDGNKKQVITATSTKAFNIASTTLDASGMSMNIGTSTFLLMNNPEAITLAGFYCVASTTGTAMVRFGDGTNWTEEQSCTTGAFTRTSTNNTWTAFEAFNLQASSTAATKAQRITVTAVFTRTAD